MSRLKILRLMVAYAGLISFSGTLYRLPLLLKMSSEGEISTVKMLCMAIGIFSLLVGVLRFLLSDKSEGIPFVLAFFALLPGLMGVPLSVLSMWYLLMVLTSAVGVFAGFLAYRSHAASGD